MTYTEMATEITYNIGRGSTTEIAAMISGWINRVQRKVCQGRNWYFLRRSTTQAITVVTSSTDYNLPAYAAGPPIVWEYKDDAIFWIAESGSTEYAILPIKGELDAMRYFSSDDTGKPEAVVLKGTQYTLFPFADGSYTLYIVYYGYLPDLSGSNDNELSIRKPELLIYGATAEGYRYLQEHEQAMAWDAKFREELADLSAMDTARKLGQAMELSPRSGARGSTMSRSRPRVLDNYY